VAAAHRGRATQPGPPVTPMRPMRCIGAGGQSPLPYQREAEIVLEMWRAVERELRNAPDDSPEAEELQAEALRLRDEYQRLIKEALAHHRPVPPPLPTEP
jgi:hypothetical protein